MHCVRCLPVLPGQHASSKMMSSKDAHISILVPLITQSLYPGLFHTGQLGVAIGCFYHCSTNAYYTNCMNGWASYLPIENGSLKTNNSSPSLLSEEDPKSSIP